VQQDLQPLSEMPSWLRALARKEDMRSALVRTLPDLASGVLTMAEMDREGFRLKRDSWTTTFVVTLEGPGVERQTLRLRGAVYQGELPPKDDDGKGSLGSPGWQRPLSDHRLVLSLEPPDVGLPSMPILTDPIRARALLEDGIRRWSPAYGDLHIGSCEPRVARYHPGTRCTIVYRLHYDEGAAEHWPKLVVAKTYSGEKGRIAWDGMRAVWQSPLGSTEDLSIAEPLAFIPELNVLVQGPVLEEKTMSDLLEEVVVTDSQDVLQEFRAFIGKTAKGLAALHGCGVDIGQVVTWEDEIAEAREVMARLATWIPELENAASSTLSRLEVLASEFPAQPAGPSHRSFRPAQVLLHRGAIAFIDFDGFCQCEPAIDVALFRATMKHTVVRTLRKRTSDPDEASRVLLRMVPVLDDLCEEFTGEYERFRPISRERVALWEALDLLTNVLHNWTKVRPERIEGTLLLLDRHLRNEVAGQQ
jgi:hypothetical protein